MTWILFGILLLLFQVCRLLAIVARNQAARAVQLGAIIKELRKR